MAKRETKKTTELSAIAELLKYARLTAIEFDQPFLAHLIQMAVDESRRVGDKQTEHLQLSDTPQRVVGVP